MDINSAIKPYFVGDMFANYEINKLAIIHPDLLNLLIIALFFCVVVVTAKKEESVSRQLLSRLHTDQLRGVGIFFVVLGHLWVHVSKTKAQIVLSGDSVSLFLILSGFGLYISSRNKILPFKEFCLKRIKRVMIPYWIATSLILFLDFIILNRTLSLNNFILTTVGINTSVALRQLDYARWFVTFILLWYILFYVFFVKFNNNFSQIIFVVISIILLPLNYYLLHFGWYQFVSFPVGCLLAINLDKIKSLCQKNNVILLISVVGIIYVISYKLLLSNGLINNIITNSIPNILLSYIGDVNSMVMSVSIIFITWNIISIKGIKSNILVLLGKYSYEIFLIHGVFLIKYNPAIKNSDNILLILQFAILFMFIFLVSFIIYNMHNIFYAKKTI